MAQRGGHDAQWPPQAPGAGQVTDSQRRPMSAGARHHQSFSPAQDHMELLDMVAEVRPSPQRPSGPRPSGRGQRPNSAGVLVPQSAATPPGGLKASPLTGQSAKTPGARPRPASARPASSRGRVVVSDTTRLNSARPASAGWREAPRRNVDISIDGVKQFVERGGCGTRGGCRRRRLDGPASGFSLGLRCPCRNLLGRLLAVFRQVSVQIKFIDRQPQADARFIT